MSGIKKAFRKVERLAGKIADKTTGGVHKSWTKIRHKILKSKVFKVVAAAVVIYFGGAALMSMAGGGTASAGIGSAWAGAQGAGSAVMAGNFSGAASALGSGFTGGAAAGATGTFSAGQALTAQTIASDAAVTAGAAAGTSTGGASTSTAGASTSTAGASTGAGELASSGDVVSALGESTVSNTASNTAAEEAAKKIAADKLKEEGSKGLLSSAWNSLGDYGKAAVVSGGVQMVGSAINGKAEQDAAEAAAAEARKKTYWGIDADGNAALNAGEINFGLLGQGSTASSKAQTAATPTWQTSLDELIQRQKAIVGGYA